MVSPNTAAYQHTGMEAGDISPQYGASRGEIRSIVLHSVLLLQYFIIRMKEEIPSLFIYLLICT